MGWLKKARSSFSIKNIRRKTTTLKGVTSLTKNVTGIGLLERSKDARKVALIGAAAGGAYLAAPYIGAGAKFAAAKIGGIGTKIGAVAGNLLTRNLSPGQVNDQVGPPEPTSPVEQNYYNETGSEEYPNFTAGSNRIYGSAAGAGTAGMSSCSANAEASGFFVDSQSFFDYIINTVGWIDGTIFVIAIVGIFGLVLDSYFTVRKIDKLKGF